MDMDVIAVDEEPFDPEIIRPKLLAAKEGIVEMFRAAIEVDQIDSRIMLGALGLYVADVMCGLVREGQPEVMAAWMLTLTSNIGEETSRVCALLAERQNATIN